MSVALDARTSRRVLRDADIRAPLETWIRSRHAKEPDTRVLHEMHIPRPSARVDLAVVNGRLAGFEIKSDADTSARLGRQVASFSNVFERMTLVTTERHLKNLRTQVPDWWEIIVCDGERFRVQRRGRANLGLDLTKLLHILTKHELLQVEQLCCGETKPQSRRKAAIVEAVLAGGSPRPIRAAVRGVLKRR